MPKRNDGAEERLIGEIVRRWSRAIPKVRELLKRLGDIESDSRTHDWLDADGALGVATEIQDLLDGHDV